MTQWQVQFAEWSGGIFEAVARKKNPVPWFTWLKHWDQQKKQKAWSPHAKLKKRVPFHLEKYHYFNWSVQHLFLPFYLLYCMSVKLCIAFHSPVLDSIWTISLTKLFFLLALICPDCDNPPQSRARVRALEFWLAALNVSNETTLSPSTSWRQMFPHTILRRLLKSPQRHPEEVILAQNIVQDSEHYSVRPTALTLWHLYWVLFEKLKRTSAKQLTALTKEAFLLRKCPYLGWILTKEVFLLRKALN